MSSQALNGLTVVVTRPQAQAEKLCQLCIQAGANVVAAPQITIEPLVPNQPLTQADWIIFTSSNAVLHCHTLPHESKVAAIGQRTQAALTERGISVSAVPKDDFTSEGLLCELEAHTMSQQHVVIVTGENGRTVLADALRLRGATVDMLATYRRVAMTERDAACQRALRCDQAVAILITSGEILQNFVSLYAKEATMNKGMVYIVPSPRIAQCAATLGLAANQIVTANSAMDADMLNALLTWQQGETLHV